MPEVKSKPTQSAKPEKKAKKEKWIRPSEVIYPTLKVNGIEIPEDKCRVTVVNMKDLLGWCEVQEDDEKGLPPPTLTDLHGQEIRLLNNLSNRPFDLGLAKTWQSEILKGHWRLNGETMIVGKTGLCIAMQHRAVGLVLAAQEVELRPEKWPFWAGKEPFLLGLLVTGIEETDAVINTVDTGKPRSTADAIYRSEVFAKDKPADRKTLSRMLEYAIRLMWSRTGAKRDAYQPKRTHTDTFDYLESHQRLVKCVRHIFTENQAGQDRNGDKVDPRISQYVPPGTAAGMMYLMGSSASDLAKYRAAPSEKKLDWANWEKTEKFWTEFNKAPKLEAFANVYRGLIDKETGRLPTSAEIAACVAKLWAAYVSGEKEITYQMVKPKYVKDQDGINRLAECPLFGGIDLGNPKDEAPAEGDFAEVEGGEEHQTRVRQVREEKEEKNDKPATKSRAETLDMLENEHKGHMLVFQPVGKTVDYHFWRTHADNASKTLSIPVKLDDGLRKVSVHKSKWDDAKKKLLEAGHKLVLCEPSPSGGIKTTPIEGQS